MLKQLRAHLNQTNSQSRGGRGGENKFKMSLEPGDKVNTKWPGLILIGLKEGRERNRLTIGAECDWPGPTDSALGLVPGAGGGPRPWREVRFLRALPARSAAIGAPQSVRRYCWSSTQPATLPIGYSN